MSKNFRETLRERMQDPDFRAEWEALEPERQITRAIMEAREENHMTQEQLADLETACGRLGHDAEDRVCAQRISKHKFNKNTKTHRKPPAHTRRRLRLSKSPVQPTCADGRDTYREI